MKTLSLKSCTYIKIIFLSGMMLFAMAIPHAIHVSAQTCPAGDLSGVAETDTLEDIYMSTQSWNNNNNTQSSISFQVSHNNTNGWSGRGWSPYLGWIDFNGNSATLTTVAQNSKWGNFPTNIDLTGVTPEGNVQGYNGHYTAVDDETIDNLVGAGYINFSNVIECPYITDDRSEIINLYLDGQKNLNGTCDVGTPEITWFSENVTNCRTGSGPWVSPGSRPANRTTGSGEYLGELITKDNPSQSISLSCVGTITGSPITVTASGSCTPPSPIDGVCGELTNQCTVGTLNDVVDSSINYRWECEGLHDGITTLCEFSHPLKGDYKEV